MERLTERYVIAPDGESDVWVKQHDYILAARKLCDYEDLEERLHKIFGEESTFSLADVIDTLETKLSEPDKKHPVNARILTYEEANKWEEYKDLEEQGLLVRLPCKVGDLVFIIDEENICRRKVKSIKILSAAIEISTSDIIFHKESFGETVFLTREEVEKKLKEMKKNG